MNKEFKEGDIVLLTFNGVNEIFEIDKVYPNGSIYVRGDNSYHLKGQNSNITWTAKYLVPINVGMLEEHKANFLSIVNL